MGTGYSEAYGGTKGAYSSVINSLPKNPNGNGMERYYTC